MDSPDVIKGQVLYVTVKQTTTDSSSSTNALTVWAPASGMQIRLSHLWVEVPGPAVLGAAGTQTITIATTNFVVAVFSPRLSNAAIAGLYGFYERRWAGGLLLPRGETLTVKMGTALTAGLISTMVFGREE